MIQFLSSFFNFYTFLVLLAALLDILANLLLAASHGFRRVFLGLCSLVAIGLAFYCLSVAIEKMDLAVAYAMWGSFGLIGTCLGGWIFFRQKPNFYAFLGMGIQVAGIILLHMD